MQSVSAFLDIKKLLISSDKMLCQQNARCVLRDLYVFGSSLGVV